MKKKPINYIPIVKSSKDTLLLVHTTEEGDTHCKISFQPTKMFYDSATKSSVICLTVKETKSLYKMLKKHFKKKKQDDK